MTTQVGAPTVPIYLAGEFAEAGAPLEVRNPASGELVATTFQAGPAELERATVAAVEAFGRTRRLASYERRDALAHVAERIGQDADELAELLTRVAGYLAETDLPKGAVSILPMDRPTGDALVGDERFKLLTFTGSPSVGWKMKAEAGKKKVVLELGGNAGAIVDETADLDWAVARLVYGSFAYAGQVCISVQRIYVVASIYEEFERRFIEKVRDVKAGDPLDPDTDLGPMVDGRAVARTDEWVREALAGGARALTGGKPDGQFYPPTVLVDVPRDARGYGVAAFAPVVNLFAVPDFPSAIDEINNARFGLPCGLFTNDLERTLLAHDELEVGGVIDHDVPTWRIDPMPYGRVDASGLGREGLRWSIEDMTETRLLAFARPL